MAAGESAKYVNMVRAFRMSELQTLMAFAGRSKAGRKTELQARAEDLCELNTNDINLKIKELSAAMYKSLGAASPSSYSSSTSLGSRSASLTYSNPVTEPVQSIVTPPPAAHQLSYPTYPDVSLKKLPFYRQEETLLKPCSLQPSGSARFQEQQFTFILKPSEATAISTSQYKTTEQNRLEYRTQIQMRFSLLETSCEQEDNFPPSICVKINGKLCPLPNPVPTSKPGGEPTRPPRPINITPLCKLSSTSANYISVSWAVEVGKAHTVSVYMVENLNYKDLLALLKAKGQRQPDYTRALIKEKLADQDQEIATTSCKVTLACPLGKMRMVTPARASTCDHLQCFDAQLYLAMNEKKPKWRCPVCNKPALMENLLVDGFFTELIGSSRLPPDEHEILLLNDGSWVPMPVKVPEHLRPQPPSSVQANARVTATLSLDSDEETAGAGPSKAARREEGKYNRWYKKWLRVESRKAEREQRRKEGRGRSQSRSVERGARDGSESSSGSEEAGRERKKIKKKLKKLEKEIKKIKKKRSRHSSSDDDGESKERKAKRKKTKKKKSKSKKLDQILNILTGR